MSGKNKAVVIAGLDPAIHRAKRTFDFLMDARVILFQDGAPRLLPAHDELRLRLRP